MSLNGLFIGNNSNVYALFASVGVARMNCRLEQAINFKEAQDLVVNSETQYDFFVIYLPQEGTPEFLNFLNETEAEIPVLFTADENTLQRVHNLLPLHPLTTRICYNMGEKVISNALRRIIKVKEKHVKSKEDYCPLPISFFTSLSKASFDTYIKLSDEKFVLLFRKGLPFDIERINQYKLKSCQYLYLKDSDYLKASADIFEKISAKIKPEKLNTEKLGSLAKLSLSTVHRAINHLGIREEALMIADVGINATKELVGRVDKNLAKHLKSVLSGRDYHAEHTMLSIFIATAVAKELDMVTAETRDKIIFSLFFHDICTEDEELAQSDDPRNISGISERRLKEYIMHPQNAVELLSKVSNLPMDIDRIILLHHEKPDGSGFPKGLDWKKIFPLGAVVIFAHDLSKLICASGIDGAFLDDIFDEYEMTYNKGNFKMVLEGARRAFGIRKKHSLGEPVKKVS
jgi:hypothetical protein